VADDFGDGFFFVERRDLDNQLHGISPQVGIAIIPAAAVVGRNQKSEIEIRVQLPA
jgi:hypothetical protein